MAIHTDPNSAHAVYAPSSASRWTKCTASAEAIAGLPEQEEGEEAHAGTAAHDEIERRLARVAARLATADILPPNSDHPAAHGVALVVDYTRQLVGVPTVDDRLWIEQRVALTDQIWGRCDVAHWHAQSRTLTIVDYKNGQRAVDVEENAQLRIYAAATMFTRRLPVTWIRYVIVQPNDWRPFVPRVKQWVEPVDDLYSWAEIVAAIPSQPRGFVAGEHCRNCPLFGHCNASRDVLAQLAHVIASSVETVQPRQVKLFLALKKPIEDWFKTFEKGAMKRALGGEVLPGMKLVTTRPHRQWRDEEEVRKLVIDHLGILALDPPSPAQAIDRGVPKDAVESVAIKPDGGPALAFDNDKRPEWKVKSAADMFGAIAPQQRTNFGTA